MNIPARLMVFTDRPDCLLIVANDGAELRLPVLVAPFTKASVASAFGEVGLDYRVSESIAGRWNTARIQARKAERAERAQRNNMRLAAEAAAANGSPSDAIREHAGLTARKLEVDREIGKLKTKIAEAKSKAFTSGQYMDPTAFRRMESKLEALKNESQAIQVRFGEMRVLRKQINIAKHEATGERFINAAREFLDEDEFEAIMAVAVDEEYEAAE